MEDSKHYKTIKIGNKKITIGKATKGKKSEKSPFKVYPKKENKDSEKKDTKDSEVQNRAGGSNVGKYKHVSKKNFAGPAGGAPKGSYPINTEKRAKAALSYAHNAPNPDGIKKAVYKKYPDLGKNKKG